MMALWSLKNRTGWRCERSVKSRVRAWFHAVVSVAFIQPSGFVVDAPTSSQFPSRVYT